MVFAEAARGEEARGSAGSDGPKAPPHLAETIAALVALGCRLQVAERAAQRAWEILGADAEVSELVREGLKHRY